MPNIGGVQYPYTPQGVAAAQQAQAGLDSARMSPPLTSPSHPMAQRQVPDLREYGGWRSDPSYGVARLDPVNYTDYSQSPSYFSPYHGGGAAAQRQVPDLQPARSDNTAWRGMASRSPSAPNATVPTYEDRYTMQSDPNRWTSGASMRGQQQYGNSPSNPSYQPIAQAPRGQMIETTDPGVGYGNSPSNPNWGQERGGSVGRMGPTNVPASTNYSAISPSNRIAGNISAVMSGRQGPSPGTSPYLNQSGRLESPPNARPWTGFGPTGQPVPSRQPVQKNDPRG